MSETCEKRGEHVVLAGRATVKTEKERGLALTVRAREPRGPARARGARAGAGQGSPYPQAPILHVALMSNPLPAGGNYHRNQPMQFGISSSSAAAPAAQPPAPPGPPRPSSPSLNSLRTLTSSLITACMEVVVVSVCCHTSGKVTDVRCRDKEYLWTV